MNSVVRRVVKGNEIYFVFKTLFSLSHMTVGNSLIKRVEVHQNFYALLTFPNLLG